MHLTDYVSEKTKMSIIGPLYRRNLTICQSLYSRYISHHLGFVGKGAVILRHCRIYDGGEKHIHIGANTLISEHCIIESWSEWGNQRFNPGIIIGDNVIIAANSVVIDDLPSNCMAAGMPAVIKKKLG